MTAQKNRVFVSPSLQNRGPQMFTPLNVKTTPSVVLLPSLRACWACGVYCESSRKNRVDLEPAWELSEAQIWEYLEQSSKQGPEFPSWRRELHYLTNSVLWNTNYCVWEVLDFCLLESGSPSVPRCTSMAGSYHCVHRKHGKLSGGKRAETYPVTVLWPEFQFEACPGEEFLPCFTFS